MIRVIARPRASQSAPTSAKVVFMWRRSFLGVAILCSLSGCATIELGEKNALCAHSLNLPFVRLRYGVSDPTVTCPRLQQALKFVNPSYQSPDDQEREARRKPGLTE